MMKLRRFTVLLATIFFAFLVSCPGYAAALKELLNGVHTMQADFTQVIYDNNNKPVQTSYGRMALQRPGKFRWQITKPIPQVIIANDRKLWIYDPDLEQVSIRSLKTEAGEAPALLLSHVDTVFDKEFVIKEIQKNNQPGWQWFSLTPVSADSMFAETEMGFMNGQIQEMRLKDHLGHTTHIKFEHIKANINLPASLFVFKAPANVDVIDETKNG